MVQKSSRPHLTVVPDDRRERARKKKRQSILRAADTLVAEEGLRSVTMARVAERLDCAVGTLYLYFPSKNALLAALQGEAIATLRASFEAAQETCSEYLGEAGLVEPLPSWVRLISFGAFWAAASVVFRDEFDLQRALLSDPVGPASRQGDRENDPVMPLVELLLDHPTRLIEEASADGALDGGDSRTRALIWISAMNGVLLLDGLAAVDRHLFRAHRLARSLSEDLLVGWGADREDIEVAAAHVERLGALAPLAPLTAEPTS